MNIHFLSFATSNWEEAKRRYEIQLNAISDKFSFFKSAKFLTEKDLGDDYNSSFKEYLSDHGYAYWSWKPYLLSKKLEEIDDGDFILYMDGGCSFPEDDTVLNEFLLKVSEKCNELNDKELFIGCSKCKTASVNKIIRREILEYFNLLNDMDFLLNFPHYQAGVLLIRKNDASVNFVNEWFSIMKSEYKKLLHFSFFDKREQVPGFIHHGGDQAIFLCLLHKNNINVLNCDDLFLDFKVITRIRK